MEDSAGFRAFDGVEDLEERTFRGSEYTFVVLSRSRIRNAVLSEPYIVISVSDAEDEDAEIRVSPLCRAVLRLRFDDVDPQRPSLRRGLAMTVDDARALLKFVGEHTAAAGVSTLVCQCGLGISRSAAIAAALSRLLQGEDAFFFSRFSPNLYVYRTVLGAAGSRPRV